MTENVEYWKKRYMKLLELIECFYSRWEANWVRDRVEEEIEVEEVESEGTIEDAKLKKIADAERFCEEEAAAYEELEDEVRKIKREKG